MALTGSDIFKLIFAVILPPLGVLLEKGCGCDFVINVVLTCLGFIPGIVHAIYIILKY
ncbi:plasma membrane proteolipid Pmp3 [Mortierella sp. AM989]|nr:plasma membrane proteolipid Pmp3 [Mortierella sp. AM989]